MGGNGTRNPQPQRPRSTGELQRTQPWRLWKRLGQYHARTAHDAHWRQTTRTAATWSLTLTSRCWARVTHVMDMSRWTCSLQCDPAGTASNGLLLQLLLCCVL